MNLEDLILETQISELKRLQTRCLESRENVVRIRAQLAEIERHSEDARASILSQQEVEKKRQIESLDVEVRNRLQQTEVDVAGRRESASETRERLLSELHAKLKEDVAECRQKLQDELWVLQSVCDESNEDTPVRNAERAQEVFNTQQTFIEQQLTDLDARVTAGGHYLASCHAGMDSVLPPAAVELKGREASRTVAVEQVDLALVSAGKLDGFSLPQWIYGWRLYGLGLLVFVVVAIGVTALKADLSKFLNPEFSKPDWEWLGVSCLIGLGAAVLVNVLLLLMSQSRLRGAFEEVLQATSNARSASDYWKQKSRQELQRLAETADKWKTDMLRRREQHAGKLQASTDESVNSLIQTYTEQVARQSRLFDDQNMAGESASSLNQTALANWRSQQLVRIDAYYQTQLEEACSHFLQETESKRQQLLAEETTALSRWQSNVMIASELARISNDRSEDFPGWSALKANGWTAPASLPSAFPVGDISVMFPVAPEAGVSNVDAEHKLAMPGLLNFPRDTSMLVEHDSTGRDTALDFVRAILLRLLTNITPGRVQFTLIDPVGLGQSFSALMHLADFDELLISNRIWTDATQIRDRLQKVTEHMESVFQTYLRSEFETIEDYNAAAGEVAEPYHFVVVAGFPNNFTEEAARALTSILTSGPRCGVHAIVTWSPDQPVPRSFDVSNLRNCCTQFHVAKGKVQPGVAVSLRSAEKASISDEDFLNPKSSAPTVAGHASSVEFTALAPPESADYVSLVRAVGEQSKNARRVEVSFGRIAPKADAVWSLSSADGIDFPIGRAGAARLQFMKLGRGTSQHVLVAGKTGSGKSTLLHILITNLALYYSPDEVQFYLIDFKKGVEFRTYAANKLPHARVVAIESDREFGLSVLERLDEILQERGELFRVRGVQDVPSFRRQFPDEAMPRLLLLIDEFQEFFTSEDRVSSKAALVMDRLVRQGRAFGIHVLLGSQTLGGAYSLARSTLGQVAVRIALQCSESDAHLILSEENSAARLLTRPGEAIYNDSNGTVEGNHPFQIAWLDEEEREQLIHKLTERPDLGDYSTGRMIVFEGNVSPILEDCEPLVATVFGRSEQVANEPMAWIGDPVAIAQPVHLQFLRSGGQNVLIVGQEGDQADAVFASTILSLCAGGDSDRQAASSRMIFLHDGRDPASLTRFRQAFTPEATPRFSMRDAAEADSVIADLWTLMTRRESANTEENASTIVLAIRNLGQFRTLRRDEDDFGMGSFGAPKTVSVATQLGDLIRKGPLVGIHVLIWADTFGNAMRWLSNSLLREFDSRIAFRLNQTDSSSLIDTPAASTLTPGRAILYRDQTGSADRFRPFSWPTEAWLRSIPAMPLAEDDKTKETIESAAEVVIDPVVEMVLPETETPVLPDEAIVESAAIHNEEVAFSAAQDAAPSTHEIDGTMAVADNVTEELPEFSSAETVLSVATVLAADEPVENSIVSSTIDADLLIEETAAIAVVIELPVTELPVIELPVEVAAAEAPPFADDSFAETSILITPDVLPPIAEASGTELTVADAPAGNRAFQEVVADVVPELPELPELADRPADVLPPVDLSSAPAAAPVAEVVESHIAEVAAEAVIDDEPGFDLAPDVAAVMYADEPQPLDAAPTLLAPPVDASAKAVEVADDLADFELEGSPSKPSRPTTPEPVSEASALAAETVKPVTARKSPDKPQVVKPAASPVAKETSPKSSTGKTPAAKSTPAKPSAPSQPAEKAASAEVSQVKPAASKGSSRSAASASTPAKPPVPAKPAAPLAKTPAASAPPAAAVPPTPVAQSPSVGSAPAVPSTPAAQPAARVKMSAMAMKMSNRTSSPRRLLDAPPEPKNPAEARNPGTSADQPAPDGEFDEMDFNSLMIE